MTAPFASYADLPPAAVIESFSPPEAFDRNQLFVAQTRHFVETVQGQKEPLCGLADGIMVLRLALAAKESQEKSRIISLDG